MDEMNKFEVHFKCMKVEEPTPEPTPDPTAELTTLEPTTNSFYLNGLDQEYLSILFKLHQGCITLIEIGQGYKFNIRFFHA